MRQVETEPSAYPGVWPSGGRVCRVGSTQVPKALRVGVEDLRRCVIGHLERPR